MWKYLQCRICPIEDLHLKHTLPLWIVAASRAPLTLTRLPLLLLQGLWRLGLVRA